MSSLGRNLPYKLDQGMYRKEKSDELIKSFSFPQNDMHMGGFPTLTILEFIWI